MSKAFSPEAYACMGVPKQSPARFKQIQVVESDYVTRIYGLDLKNQLWYTVFGSDVWNQIDGPMQDNF